MSVPTWNSTREIGDKSSKPSRMTPVSLPYPIDFRADKDAFVCRTDKSACLGEKYDD